MTEETAVAVQETVELCACGKPLHHRGRCPRKATVTERSGGNVELTATSADAIPHLQGELLAWARQKLELVKSEWDEAAETYLAACDANFRTAPLERAAARQEKRYEFYSKILAALEAGYVLMPTLGVDVFAVRTNRKGPKYQWVRFERDIPPVPAMALPAGAGRYVSSEPLTAREMVTQTRHDGTKEDVCGHYPAEFDPEIEFPLAVAKPAIIEVVSQAIEKKIFDEIGLSPRRWETGGDPIVTGRIIAPRGGRRISFLLAWHVPTIDL